MDPRYAVAFLMRYASSWRPAANELSKAAYNDLVSVEEMAQFLTPGQNAMTGVPAGASGAPVGRGERLVAVRAADVARLAGRGGPPAPLCNRPVFDLAGRHVATRT